MCTSKSLISDLLKQNIPIISSDNMIKSALDNKKAFIYKKILHNNESLSSDLGDLVISLKISTEQNNYNNEKIIFNYQDKSEDKSKILFEFELEPDKKIIFIDPIPLCLLLFTKIWYSENVDIEFETIIITNHDLRNEIMTSQTIGSINDDWIFVANDKYFIHNGGLYPSSYRQNYYTHMTKNVKFFV